jgi:NAD(P)-dependent dehydrogenase (short-subunit alcohol dehydrogenase family)
LKQAAKEGGGIVVAATGMGGRFASDPNRIPDEFFPGNGAIPGMLKTVAVEWPEIKIKSVDLNLKEPEANLADHLLTEILGDGDLVEVGYDGNRRLSLGIVEAPLTDRAEDLLRIDSSWIILVTRGARGITARVACELARRHQPTLILAGRSPLPPEEESEETADLVDEKELKSALISDMKRRGENVSLADVEAAYKELCKEREIRANLATMRQSGARVDYFQVDVRDEQQFGRLIDDIYQTHGRLDGVIHGAGIIDDKLLTDKTWESFARVFYTKSDSVFILSRKLRFESLKFLALFSSVAGRFSSRGQCDYTAANEVINKFANYLDKRWSGRAVSVNWGPWEMAGMVSAEVQRQFNERGVGLVPPAAGADIFDTELRKGRKGEVEVVIGDGPWRKEAGATGAAVEKDPLPALSNHSAVVSKNDGSLEIQICLNPGQHLYLQDHRLDSKPVLPAAMAIEMIAEAAQMRYSEHKVAAVNNVRVLKGIILNDSTSDIRLLVRPHVDLASEKDTIQLESMITDSHPIETLHYKATVLMNSTPHSHPKFEPSSEAEMHAFWTSVRGAYENWLFHGPKFQCIQSIEGISEQGMFATLAPSFPKEFFENELRGNWLIDPIALDGGLQLALLWARNYLDITLLPSNFRSVQFYKPFFGVSSIRCHLQVNEVIGQNSVSFNIIFMDQDDNLLAIVDGLEASGSKSLNRLGGSHLIGIDTD